MSTKVQDLKKGDRIKFPGGRILTVVRVTQFGDRLTLSEPGHGTNTFRTVPSSRFQVEA